MTKFQRLVFAAVATIPKGQVSTYGDIAKYIGNPSAARAVGNALHANADPISTPCHRVVGCSGRLAESYAFGGAAAQAEKLIAEGVAVSHNKVININNIKKDW